RRPPQGLPERWAPIERAPDHRCAEWSREPRRPARRVGTERQPAWRNITRTLLILALLLGAPPASRAQQPFYTDDADVTPAGRVHVELFNEYDWLQASQAPHRQQNTFNAKVNYGLGRGVELDLDSPLITIV